MRGLPRCFAQRPLPSMMTAMCWGRRSRSIDASSFASDEFGFSISAKCSCIGRLVVGHVRTVEDPLFDTDNRVVIQTSVDVRIHLVVCRRFLDEFCKHLLAVDLEDEYFFDTAVV